MEAAKNPEYLRALARAVDEFRVALESFLELHTLNNGTPTMRAFMPAVFPRESADPEEIKRRKSAVAIAAGHASEAPRLTHSYWAMQGHQGPIDPIASWAVIVDPKPLLEPQHILESCDQMQGRLGAMILKAEAELPPTIGVAEMHPLIWGAARTLWQARTYRHAVAAAAGALIEQVKIRTGRNDVPETSLWQQVFSKDEPEAGKPRLRWPGNPTDNDVKNINDGLRQFAPGVQMMIRNPAIHVQLELDQQDALERLGVLSLLARTVEGCVLVEA